MSRSKYHQLVYYRRMRAELRARPRSKMLDTALQDVEDRIALFEEIHRRTGSQTP